MTNEQAIRKAADICGWTESHWPGFPLGIESPDCMAYFYASDCEGSDAVDALALQLWRNWLDKSYIDDDEILSMSQWLQEDSLSAIKLMLETLK